MDRKIRSLALLASATLAVVVFTFLGSSYIASVDLRARQETRALLETYQQQTLLRQIVEADLVWAIKFTESTSGLPYMHEVAIFAQAERAACQEQLVKWLAYKAAIAKTVGPHYVVTVSSCRSALIVRRPQ